MAFDKATFLARLEDWGEAVVRERLATKVIADPKKIALAEGFLERKAQERAEELERRKDVSNREHINIARKAKNAQMIAAIAAVILAIVAIITSFLS